MICAACVRGFEPILDLMSMLNSRRVLLRSDFCSPRTPYRASWLANNRPRCSGRWKSSTVVPTPATPATWVDRLPQKVRPYLYLTRIDKPIGTLLLFYPCGSSSNFISTVVSDHSFSMVHRHGVIFSSPADHNTSNLPESFWSGCFSHAWCRLHHQ